MELFVTDQVKRPGMGERLYLAALLLWGISLLIALSASLRNVLPFVVHLKYPLMAACACLLFIKIAGFQRFSYKSALIALAVLFTGVMSSIFSHDAMPVVIAAFLVSSEGIRLDNVVKTVLFYTLLSLAVSGLISMLFGNAGLYRYDIDGIKSLALGFGSKNTLGGYLLSLVACLTFLLEKKQYKLMVISSLIVLIIDYALVNSRTSSLILLLIIIYQLFGMRSSRRCSSKLIFFISFICIASISVAVCVCYSNRDPLLVGIDDLFSNRLSLAHYYLVNYGIKPFGQQIDFTNLHGYFIDASYYAIDNAYCHFLIAFGVVPFLLYVSANIVTCIKGDSIVSHTAMTLFICFVVYGACECFSYYPQLNPFFSIIGMVIFSDSSRSFGRLSNKDCQDRVDAPRHFWRRTRISDSYRPGHSFEATEV